MKTDIVAENIQKKGHYDLDGMREVTAENLVKTQNPTAKNPDLDIKIGINVEDRTLLSKSLCTLLADTYTLYLKTQNFHWNVAGARFLMLHELFERQYKQLAESIDTIAERIRALGFRAPGTYGEFQALTSIVEEASTPTEERMIELLVSGYETLIHSVSKIAPLADNASDLPTNDLAAKLSNEFQKSAWMLRSHLPARKIPDDLM